MKEHSEELINVWKMPMVTTGRLSRGKRSGVWGHETGCMGMEMRVIRFHRKLELLTAGEVNKRHVGRGESAQRVSSQPLGTQF